MITRGQFSQLLAPGISELMYQWLDDHPEEYSQFLVVEPTENAYDQDQIIGGLGLARLKPEGEGIQYDDPIQGGSKRYVSQTYALGTEVTMEMLDDDRYDIISQIPGEMMRGCSQLVESLGAAVLNGAFGTMTTADGVSICNTAHPLLGGGTYGNRLSPDAALSVTSLQDMINLFENMVDERGLKVRLIPHNLWIPVDLQFTASRILQSEYEPGTGNNDINTVRGRLTPAVLHYLTSQTAWFVSSNDLNKLKFKWRKHPVQDSQDDFNSKGSKFSVVFRCAAGGTEWRGWAGSTP